MERKLKRIDMLITCIIILLIIITLVGACSFQIDKSYMVTNQYGDAVKIFGSGIYAHDSYFKAPIFIGTDYTMLFVAVPILIVALFKDIKKRSIKSKLFLISIVGLVLYYSTSIAFGVTYNALHLLYIALFSTSLFTTILLVKNINTKELRRIQKLTLPSKGLTIFLTLSGLALFVAWLPDIITSLLNEKSLSLIEVYTTEITYVVDMGIMSPLIFICLYLLKKKDGLGDIILAFVLRICEIMGIMLPVQSLFQALAGIELPIPALITKVGIFIILAIFSIYFNIKLYKNIEE
ncbi:hypothetical protein [Clostridium cellulovorans]|uniref:Lipoprotein n=1 Tax=Clostridium cellulovorans (strain ATCC 35296 / DSM 3052 / OCM 3 / 743B) TaxID=573061 RepID=D9SPL6_CLOC7|nr:hypothetical protein [Clostridium cellulovorans]ADL50065.1 hypothetical protein Clocel_0284 [Clostridium cellulovorans 743B]